MSKDITVHYTCRHADVFNFTCGDCMTERLAEAERRGRDEIMRRVRDQVMQLQTHTLITDEQIERNPDEVRFLKREIFRKIGEEIDVKGLYNHQTQPMTHMRATQHSTTVYIMKPDFYSEIVAPTR